MQRPELARWKPPGDQAENALLLGAVIAEGFIAVEAEDTAEAKSVGRAVLKLAAASGWKGPRSDAAAASSSTRRKGTGLPYGREWDGVLPDVQQGMKQLKSDQLAQLVSLGGWVRGSEAFAALVPQNHSKEDAELFRQPALFNHFEKQLAGVSGDVATDPIVVTMGAGLRKVRKMLASGGTQISPEKVKQISSTSSELIQSLK